MIEIGKDLALWTRDKFDQISGGTSMNATKKLINAFTIKK